MKFKKLHQIINNRKNILVIVLFIAPIIFKSFFENLLNNYITKPIYSNIESNIYVDLIFIAITIIMFLDFYIKFSNGYLKSSFKTYLVIIFSFWYINYRFFRNNWEYPSLLIYPSIFYTDILIVILITRIPNSWIIKIRNWFGNIEKLKKQDTEKNSIESSQLYKGFLLDKPAEMDLLGRKGYAESIAQKLLYSFPTDSFAVSIIGKWGSGKTSFINLIKEKLKELNTKEHNQKIETINFNPWINHTSQNCTKVFFDNLSEKLSEYDGSVAFKIDEYSKQLTTVDDNIYFKTIEFLNKLIFGEKTTQSIFNEINDTIRNINKQFVVFIDDLDRLDCKEIIEVIKLIRTSANFKNIIFVVAFDKSYITNAIGDEFNNHDNEWFLEKIFQAEFLLPTIQKKAIQSELIKKLKNYLPQKVHEDIDHYFSDLNYNNVTNENIYNLRDIQRFVNSFCISHKLVEDEILFKDFLNIELIKYKYSSAYELFFNQYSHFLDTTPFLTANYDYLTLNSKSLTSALEEIKSINPNKIQDIVKSFDMIFPTLQSNSNLLNNINLPSFELTQQTNLSIRRPSNLLVYSSMRLSDSNVSQKEFTKFRQEEDNDIAFQLQVDAWINNGLLHEVLEKFEIIEFFDNEKDFVKIFKMLLNIGNNDLCKNGYQSNTISKLIISRIEVYSKQKQENIESLVKNILEEQNYIPFKFCFLNVVNAFNPEPILNDSLRLQLLYSHLEIHLESSNKFSRQIWEFYNNCSYTDLGVTDTRNGVCEDRVNILIKTFAIDKDIKGFLESLICTNNSEVKKLFALSDFPNKLLFSPNENDLINFISNLKPSEYKDIFLKFYNELKTNSFNFISFDFKNILKI